MEKKVVEGSEGGGGVVTEMCLRDLRSSSTNSCATYASAVSQVRHHPLVPDYKAFVRPDS